MSNSESCLVNKTCVPCKGGTPPLPHNKANELLSEVGGGWTLNQAGHLYKKFTFKDFTGAMTLANQIAELAEQEGHHPDLAIAWGSCAVEIWTHKINGLSESDFILAAKIEAIN